MKKILALAILFVMAIAVSSFSQVYIPGVEDTLRGKYVSSMISQDEGKTWLYQTQYLGEIKAESVVYPSGKECEFSRIVSADLTGLHYNTMRASDGSVWGVAYTGVGITFIVVYIVGDEEVYRWLCHKI